MLHWHWQRFIYLLCPTPSSTASDPAGIGGVKSDEKERATECVEERKYVFIYNEHIMGVN